MTMRALATKPRYRGVSKVPALTLAIKLLAARISLFSSDKGSVGIASWGARAQAHGAARQRQRPAGGRRPMLHNPSHESTVRNVLFPKFRGPGSNPLISGNHTSNVAVVVSSSRYWFNYRHVTNALSIYHLLKRGGITDDNIVLMLADDIPCNSRNPFRGKIFPRGAKGGMGEDLMEGAEVDYSGTDVTVDAFLRVLLGRHLPGEEEGGVRSLPKLDKNTNILVYLTGHGGDNFFKFQDGEELMSHDIASAFSQMYELGRYNEILFIADTCQAFTMADQIKVPNVYSVGSSLKGQNSYASHSDKEVGQSVIDRYSKAIKDFVDDSVVLTSDHSSKNNNEALPFDNATVAVMDRLNLHDALVRIPMNHGDLGPNSHVGHADHLCSREMNKVPLSDFFAASAAMRESQMSRGELKASLWMHDMPMVMGQIDGQRLDEEDSEEECVIDEEPHDDDINEEREQENVTAQKVHKVMSPSDPKFIFATVGFLLCVYLTSRIW